MDSFQFTARGRWFKKNLRNLEEQSCSFTSKCTTDYNCVGYAVGDYRWWHPVKQREHYWPDGVPRNFLTDSYILALETAHFEECSTQDATPEGGYEKVAVYSFGPNFKHVAVIVSADIWKSKLGELEDIEHPPAPKKLGKFGTLYKYLRREMRYVGQPLPREYKL